MMWLLRRLERKRVTCRKRVMAHFADLDRRFCGLAVFVFFFSLLPIIMFPPAEAVLVIPEAVAVGALVFVGCIFAATIILLPVALIFF